MSRRDGVSVRLFPSTDRQFSEAVNDALDGRDHATLDAAGLEEMLRAGYPYVRVVEQQALAALVAGRVLYVFRDGSPVSRPGEGPGTALYRPLRLDVALTLARSLELLNRSILTLAWARDAVRRPGASPRHAVDRLEPCTTGVAPD